MMALKHPEDGPLVCCESMVDYPGAHYTTGRLRATPHRQRLVPDLFGSIHAICPHKSKKQGNYSAQHCLRWPCRGPNFYLISL